MYRPISVLTTLFLLLAFFSSPELQAQKRKKNKKKEVAEVPTLSYPESMYQAMSWRNVGPHRGGRSTTVAGLPHDPFTYYMGTTGGGLWKTTDAGATWSNISDGFFKTGSVGAIAIADADPNVIIVGMGEAPVRGVMTSHGDGVYKSTDAGKTWKHMGLNKVRQISRIRIHPKNPDLIYVAAQGSPYGFTEDRGIYKSSDGGENWEKVLYVSEKAGASDLSMDAHNPRVLYAAFWEHIRHPWKVVSGGPGSGIYKSTDGGENWEELSSGLPDLMGKIGVSVSPADPNRVYAIIESPKGGLYRSDNAGESWRLINGDRVLHARSWYYMHVFANPVDPDQVVVLNAPYLRSKDGGRSFSPVRTRHGDNHDLWYNPTNPDIQINANDGGSNITFNGGKTWTTQSNQPTAQFYRINADNRIPYYIYGGQQDNSSMAVPSRTPRGGISVNDFYPVGGCESAYTAFDPNDPTIVYAGCYQGIIEAYNTETRTGKDVMAYSFLGLGTQPKDQKYRFNWNAPILVSRHNTDVIYHAGNVLLKSTNKGLSWEAISGDLTRNVEEHLGFGGGPITSEGAGGEVYHTIYYIAESQKDAQTIWAGTDDGLLHLTKDGGKSWTNITPPDIGEAMINAIETSTHEEGTAYVAVNRYKFNDFTPHIFITKDFGNTWERKVAGIEEEAHVRVVREDPRRKGLLYAGTETGIYISFDEGNSWKKFQLNLPVVPITDLKVHHNDLLAATQGRAFWVLDDLTPLHQLEEGLDKANAHLFQPRNPYLYGGGRNDRSKTLGVNPDNGTVFFYNLASDTLKPSAKIYDEAGNMIREIKKMPAKEGMNKWVWNMQTEKIEGIKGIMVIGGLNGFEKGPGNYRMEMVVGTDTLSRSFKVLPDPRFGASLREYQEKESSMIKAYDAITELYASVRDLKAANKQIGSFMELLGDDHEELKEEGKAIQKEIKEIESLLIQPKQKTFQDVINFENKLDANLVHILGTIDGSPPPVTQGQKDRLNDVLADWAEVSARIDQLLGEKLSSFNQAIKAQDIPLIQVGKE